MYSRVCHRIKILEIGLGPMILSCVWELLTRKSQKNNFSKKRTYPLFWISKGLFGCFSPNLGIFALNIMIWCTRYLLRFSLKTCQWSVQYIMRSLGKVISGRRGTMWPHGTTLYRNPKSIGLLSFLLRCALPMAAKSHTKWLVFHQSRYSCVMFVIHGWPDPTWPDLIWPHLTFTR